jgi:hypothetical protein
MGSAHKMKMRLTKLSDLGDHIDDSGEALNALTRKGSSGGGVPIRGSLAN